MKHDSLNPHHITPPLFPSLVEEMKDFLGDKPLSLFFFATLGPGPVLLTVVVVAPFAAFLVHFRL